MHMPCGVVGHQAIIQQDTAPCVNKVKMMATDINARDTLA